MTYFISNSTEEGLGQKRLLSKVKFAAIITIQNRNCSLVPRSN